MAGLCLAVPNAAAQSEPATQGEPEQAQPVTLKIVPQTQSQGGVSVAAWLPDGRYLITASGLSGEATIWDVSTGVIVDKLRLPGTGYGTELIDLDALTISADGSTALFAANVISFGDGAARITKRTYRMDLNTRRFAGRSVVVRRTLKMIGENASKVARAATDAAVNRAYLQYMKRLNAMTVVTGESTQMPMAAANAALPALPASPDGKRRVHRESDALVVTDAQGRVVRRLSAAAPTTYLSAAMSPDGRHLALMRDALGDDAKHVVTPVQIIDMATGAATKPTMLTGYFGRIDWIDADRFVVSSGADSIDRTSDAPEDQGAPSPAQIVDASSLRDVTPVPIAGRCFTRSIGNGRFVGAGAANCRANAGNDTTLVVFDPGKGWQKIGGDTLDGLMIDLLAAAPDGKTATVAASADGAFGLFVFDLNTGAAISALELSGAKTVLNLAYAQDGQSVDYIADGSLYSWRPGAAAPALVNAGGVLPQMMVSDGKTMFMSGSADSVISRIDLATGADLPPIDYANVIAGGVVPGRPIFWAASSTGGLRLFDLRDGSTILTLYQFDEGGWLTVAPDGRYDTDLGPDANQFRWLVSDAPWQPLSPQTFMRDYFTPRLAERVMACRAADNCAATFPALPPIAALNRVLPTLKIASITPSMPGYVVVNVEAREGVDPKAANGKTRSGLYNVRLFRNNRFAAHRPIEVNEVLHQSLADWRETNGWDSGADANGVWHFPFEVPLPTAAGTEVSEFTAYAFNEDRVKSDTARATYTRPPVTPRQPRAYVITIGIDAYVEPRLALRYASADATLLSDQLAAIPGYDVRRAVITGIRLPDGSVRRVTSKTVAAVFATLVGMGDVDEVKQALKGFDVSALAQVTPDDIVIVAYSGHGYANPQGDFFIVPSNAQWPAGKLPDESQLISSADLTMYLRDVRAREIAFIIDACHSAASVASATFKPGPMGDAGLGQLAYDKGMRILAATQADDVASESPKLRQGLLTFALAKEGISTDGGKADLNGDGRITLDEWLRYAVKRLPVLSSEILGGSGAAGITAARGFTLFDGAPARAPRTQEPSLFDFTDTASPVVLRSTK